MPCVASGMSQFMLIRFLICSSSLLLLFVALHSCFLWAKKQFLFWIYRYYIQHRTLTSMNFDNPVYRKTTEDQFSLEKNLPARVYASSIDDEVCFSDLRHNIAITFAASRTYFYPFLRLSFMGLKCIIKFHSANNSFISSTFLFF